MSGQVQNKTFSILKAIGIILIVIGHSALYTPLCTFTYLIDIVIFFFVAGYFFNDDYLEKPFLFFKKKIIRFYVPWVAYGVTFVLLHNLLLRLHLLSFNFNTRTVIEPYTFSDTIHKILEVLTFFKWKEPLLNPLWFLFGIFSGLCVFFVISWIAKRINKNKFEVYRAVFIGSVITVGFAGNANNWPHGIIYRPFVIAGLIYIGKLYSIYKDKIKLSPLLAVICFVGLCVATAFNYRINIGGMLIGNPLLFLLISCSGCYMLLTLAKFIAERDTRLSVLLNFIGKHTFTIMVLHYVSFKLGILLQIWISGYPIKYLAYYPVIPFNTTYWWLLYTIIGISVPLFLSSALTTIKNRVVKKQLQLKA